MSPGTGRVGAPLRGRSRWPQRRRAGTRGAAARAPPSPPSPHCTSAAARPAAARPLCAVAQRSLSKVDLTNRRTRFSDVLAHGERTHGIMVLVSIRAVSSIGKPMAFAVQQSRHEAALTALRVALAVHQEHADGLTQQPSRLEAVPSVPNHGLTVEALAAQVHSGRMEHLRAGFTLASATVGQRSSACRVTTIDRGCELVRSAAPEGRHGVPRFSSHLLCAGLRLVPDHRRYAGPHDACLRARNGLQAATCAARAQHQHNTQARPCTRCLQGPGRNG